MVVLFWVPWEITVPAEPYCLYVRDQLHTRVLVVLTLP